MVIKFLKRKRARENERANERPGHRRTMPGRVPDPLELATR